jgi:hypothetical protein
MPDGPERRTHDYARHGTNKTPAIKAWLAAPPLFHMRFTPPARPGSTTGMFEELVDQCEEP